ncbi:MAG: cytochrome-c peroxidase [Deltaproteobacteria bacterium]|nr:cytochrome-c peroxidase [Deltaproteobacteria bacterium]
MKKAFVFTLFLFFTAPGAWAEDLRKLALHEGLQPIPANVSELNKVIGSPDEKLVELGKKLFFDPRLSKSGLISCNTCHNLATGGTDGVSAAIGHKWVANPHHLNSPTVYNSVFNSSQMWDGRFADLEEQAKGPIQAPPEMAAAPELVVSRLKSIPAYAGEFKSAFAGEKAPLTFDNVAKAIAAFERTLITPSRFDAFLNGKGKALSEGEKKGLKLFIDKGCVACHGGIGVGGGSLQPFPVAGKYKYDNLGDFKGNKNGFVKVPTLRNITNTAPYYHNGAVWTLEEAVTLMGELQLGMRLSRDEVNNIVAFLKALEGVKPKITYPVLPSSTADTPKPDAM